MTKRMLIDATHPEETRVVVLANGQIDDFEAETKGKQQLKGNIYLGHVSRVEPSLQAAFITFGGNRNGFLAFGEVHPAYFHLKADEKAKLLEELETQAARRRGLDEADEAPTGAPAHLLETAGDAPTDTTPPAPETPREPAPNRRAPQRMHSRQRPQRATAVLEDAAVDGAVDVPLPPRVEGREQPQRHESSREHGRSQAGEPRQPGIHRRYRVQDVLKEGQKVLVQVVKEERGSKGAALTTYFSLPGRYTVLMPNTPHAGGISRKITDGAERQHMRDVYSHLNVPPTMGLIIRTAGTGQPMANISHDYHNLLSLWESISQKFTAEDDIQCLHEDGSVVVRALRDMASDDLSEIVIAGPHTYKVAKDFATNMVPELAGLIKLHKGDAPLFQEAKVEQRLNQLHHSRVALPSGGYLVLNPTEALVAIDINSGRATQERNIEETALKTNLEACEEIARQIRLRDLSGLIVVDFIDMEDRRNNRKVEQAIKKALKQDRARVQMGEISQFGLLEISRQRLRPSFGESHFITCRHCQGSGLVHSPSTSALMILRRLEEDDVQMADRVHVATDAPTVLWLLNHKRELIRDLEARHKYQLLFTADDTLIAPDHRLELVRFKPDGTESSQTVAVTLREVPELPPEQRGYGKKRRDADDREAQPPRPPQAAPVAKDAPPKDAAKTPGHAPSKGRGRPPRPNAQAAAQAVVSAEAPPENTQRAAKPTNPKPVVAKPAVAKPVAMDAPLQVANVEASTEATPTPLPAKPKKVFALKKQQDTDRPDAPIQVAKVESGSIKPAAPTAKAKPEPKPKAPPKGFLSRLIGQ
jgi:ribonuclease E